MQPPIIVDNRGDVLIFDSVGKAERYLEPIDIRNQEYVIYDSEGHRLAGVVEKHFLAERVKLLPASETGMAADELRRVLIGFLEQVGSRQERPLAESSLEGLLKEALRFKTE